MIQTSELSPAELAALLAFYAEAGVEFMLEDAPVDRFAEFEQQKQARSRPAPSLPSAQGREGAAALRGEKAAPIPKASTPIVLPDAEAVAEARRLALSARDMAALRVAIDGFDHCNLKRSAKQTLFATGNAESGIMVVGAVPGADEDRDGMPFAGKAGELLDRMLASIGLKRQDIMLVNAMPWRPPGNRSPYAAEMEICRPFLERQIELSAPKAVLILGNFATRYLLDGNAAIHLARGQWRDLKAGEHIVPALPSLHPQDLLLAPGNKRLAWQDLLRFRMKLQELGLI
jgi:DNA polymerase